MEVILQGCLCLARAREEAKLMDQYDYLVVNDDLNACVEEIHRLVMRERLRMQENLDFVEKIRGELDEMTSGK